MKIVKLFLLFIFVSLISFIPSPKAYEGIFHYAWTYYLALQVGFTERQAYQIASGTNAIDWDSETNPVASPLETKIDTVLGAERFRYFDKDVNKFWIELDRDLKGSKLLVEDPNTTLLQLRRGLYEHQGALANTNWDKYYSALLDRNPAVRTWVQLHAFQPIVLQKHKIVQHDMPIDFTSNMADRIDSNSTLTSTPFNNDEKYIIPNGLVTWALGLQLPRTESKNGKYSQIDDATLDLFNETIKLCGEKSIKNCLTERISCEKLNKSARSLAKLKNNHPSALKKIAHLKDEDYLNCDENIFISTRYDLIQKIENIRDSIAKISLDTDDRSLQEALRKWEFETRINESIFALPLLSSIKAYQEKTGMSWPLIYSALVQDIKTYVLDEYWTPQDPVGLSETHAPTIAVNLVRGEVAKQLKALAEHDQNPGPLLHFIQDIHSHGPYNTYNGHALANHVPDFIDKSAINAAKASIDTIITLCEFKEHLSSKEERNDNSDAVTDGNAKLFTGTLPVESQLCKLAKEDTSYALETETESSSSPNLKNNRLSFNESKLKKYIFEQSLTEDTSHKKTLLDILIELGKQSKAPLIEDSRVTWALAEKMIVEPPHYIDGKEVTTWTNEQLGLPEFPLAIRYLRELVSPEFIPVWRQNDLRIENQLHINFGNVHKQEEKNQAGLVRRKEALKPIQIPTSVIQYDYDYCGRVVDADRGRETRKGLPAWSTASTDTPERSAESCENTSITTTSNYVIPANKLYQVEDIQLQITNMTFSNKPEMTGALSEKIPKQKDPSYYWSLEYVVSGMVPGLNGNFPIKLTKPKTYTRPVDKRIERDGFGHAAIDSLKEWNPFKVLRDKIYVPDEIVEESTDMYTLASDLVFGPTALPVYQNCQLFFEGGRNSQRPTLDAILAGKFEKSNNAEGNSPDLVSKSSTEMSPKTILNAGSATKYVVDLMRKRRLSGGINQKGDSGERISKHNLSSKIILLKDNDAKDNTPPNSKTITDHGPVTSYDSNWYLSHANDEQESKRYPDGLMDNAAYMACSVQVQGLPPVVALQKVSRNVIMGKVSFKKGATK